MGREIHIFILIIFLCSFPIPCDSQTHHYNELLPENGNSVFIGLRHDELPTGYDSVYLFVDDHSQPKFYYQKIVSPVCEDTLCRMVNLTLKWDLLGKYSSYYLDEGVTITKVGHKPFTDEEYNKLHTILADDKSILGSFSKEDITELPIVDTDEKEQNEVDAVTGATPEAIKNEIIEGALYTSHTLWHLCRGKIRDQILNHTGEMLLNEVFMHQLILSGDIHYIEFALRNLNSFDPSDFHGDIILIIQNNSSLTASRIIEYMPGTLICNNEFNDQLWNLFGDLQYLSQRQFLKKLASCNQLSDKILDGLISYSAHSIESQYVQILNTVFNQSELHMKQEESIVIIARERKEKLNNGFVQILASLRYHENMYGLRDEVLQILMK